MAKGHENLIPFGSGGFTPEQEFAIRSAGGKAGAQARKRKKTMKKLAEGILEIGVKDPDLKKLMNDVGIDPEDQTYLMAVITAQVMQAAGGNTKAAKFLAEVLGETIQAEQLKQRKAEHRHKVNIDKELLAIKKAKAEEEDW